MSQPDRGDTGAVRKGQLAMEQPSAPDPERPNPRMDLAVAVAAQRVLRPRCLLVAPAAHAPVGLASRKSKRPSAQSEAQLRSHHGALTSSKCTTVSN